MWKTVFESACFAWASLPRRPRAFLVIAATLMAAAAWMNARIPVEIGNLANGLAGRVAQTLVTEGGLAMKFLVTIGSLFLGRELLHVIRKNLVHRVTAEAEKTMTVRLVAHLLKLEIGELAAERVGALNGRVRRSVEGYVKLVMLAFMDFFPAILTAGFAVWVALGRNLTIGLIIAASLPCSLALVILQAVSQRGIRVNLLRGKEAIDGTVVEQLGGIEYIRAADTHGQEMGRISQLADELKRRELKHHRAMSYFDFAKALVEGAFFIAVTATAIWLAARNAIPIGDIITSTMLYASVLGPVREIHRIVDEAAESSIKVYDLRELLNKPADRSFAMNIPEVSASLSAPAIVAHRVWAAYGANGDARIVLRNVSVSILPGQFVGIVGRSGSGKSTFVRMLLRLIHPTRGELSVNGLPVAKLNRSRIKESIGYVGQIPFLFTGTLLENLVYGCGDISQNDVSTALEKSALASDVEQMEGRIAAPVAERGQNLSGGQRQRLTLARAFLSQAPILIFDEATANLDTLSEAKVIDSISQLRGQKTILMIAHRLATLRSADRILVFHDGEIVEDGTYDALSAAGGTFAQLARETGKIRNT